MSHNVTVIPGDGIGPEIVAAMRRVVDASGADINWEEQNAGMNVIEAEGTPLPERVLESIRRNKVAIKGPITTPVGKGFRSINVALRKQLDLYSCLRPCFSLTGVKSKYTDIDLVMVRENTEDLYAGIERMVDDDTAESIKLITRSASERIARFAFEYARRENRALVTAVHKANIMKFSDGLFLESCRHVAESYPDIKFEDRIVDNMCMQLVQRPYKYDVILTENLYGDILSDLCAGLIGGLGIAPGANIGDDIAVFEPTHGSAPSSAGQNRVNPTAIILSGVMMLKHLGERRAAEKVLKSTAAVIKKGEKVTHDLGGDTGTAEMAEAIVDEMRK